GFALLEETSDDPHHAGGPAPPPPLPSHTTVASCRPCPGPSASIFLVGPRRKALRPRRSLTTRYTAPGRRGGKHDRDSIPAHVAHASLGLMFVGLPSLCPCWRQWLHITDFDRQSSSGRTSTGRTSTGRTSTGRTSAGRTSTGRTSPGRTSAGPTCHGRTSPGRTSMRLFSATPI